MCQVATAKLESTSTVILKVFTTVFNVSMWIFVFVGKYYEWKWPVYNVHM